MRWAMWVESVKRWDVQRCADNLKYKRQLDERGRWYYVNGMLWGKIGFIWLRIGTNYVHLYTQMYVSFRNITNYWFFAIGECDLPSSKHSKAMPVQAPRAAAVWSSQNFYKIGTWTLQSCQPYALATFTPPPRPSPPGNLPFTHFCYRLIRPQGHRAAARKVKSMKNPNDPIGNRTFWHCSAVPLPSAPQRAPILQL
jgi:hypothetical protein